MPGSSIKSVLGYKSPQRIVVVHPLEGLIVKSISRAQLEHPMNFRELGQFFAQCYDATDLQTQASKDAGPDL